jgi:hypothetical protein
MFPFLPQAKAKEKAKSGKNIQRNNFRTTERAKNTVTAADYGSRGWRREREISGHKFLFFC